MEKDEKEYLTLGEVAEILKINKTTLRYYNREGLIEFERDGENNYRYYRKNQIDNFRVILNLRKVGFSLEEIKEFKKYFLNKEYGSIAKMLDKKLKEYEDEIKETENKIDILKESKKYMIYLDEISEINPEYILIDLKTKSLSKTKEEIFIIKEIEGKLYGILYVSKKISDKIAVEHLYKNLEERKYIEAGDLFIEVVKPFKELSKEDAKIKIFKIPIKPLTCHQVTGLE
ncbi:MerR family transcriptional regulator [Fusobacterium perfoetens]|uniref:MerR family transcriptional regulator n=1 Tax=Fusobacterium perfoetens TaxID=852 RepID=UPI001F286D96|nr:MerR family transcriptional regulator [Fusobacterium perfoetens]MCF2625115.1 MerR family transcriptional regulator [Fusobacterium perfoetens]